MSDEENVYKFFNYVSESIILPQSPSVEKNVTATKIDSVTDGVEFVPYWRTVKNENGVTLIVNEATRLAIIYLNGMKTANRANEWYNWGEAIPDKYKPVRMFMQQAGLGGQLVRILPNNKIQYLLPTANTSIRCLASIVYPFFNNYVDPPDDPTT